ncbi:MAG: hypothetical protein FJY88_04025 [Candidatus Eisenbacteria bacterium]|nr:hypothetical protein [Candidatus Eisenbacteria bacterium]
MVVRSPIKTLGTAVAFMAVCLIAAFSLYGRSLDDSRKVSEEELIWANGAVNGEAFGFALAGRWQAGDYRPQVRPAATLFRAGEHLLFGYDRGAYQAVQIILHAAVATIVFLLLWSLIGSRIMGAIGGILFAVHPGASHTVLYLGGLSEILCGAFFFLSILLLARRLEAKEVAHIEWFKDRGAIALGSLALLAMLSKEGGFLLPLVALAAILSRPLDLRRRAWHYAPIAGATLVALLWRIAATMATPEVMRRVPAVDPTSALPFLPLLARALAGVAVEIARIFLPLKLSHEYSWLFAIGTGEVLALAAVALPLLAVGAWLVLQRRWGRMPLVPLLLVAALPLLAPALLAEISGSVASERNLYLALPGWVGLGLLATRGALAHRRESGPILAGIAVGVIVLLGLRTVQRVPDWETDGRLLEKGLADNPANPQLIFEEGNRRLSRRDYSGANERYEEALRLRRDFPAASLNLGAAYVGMKEYGLALRALDPVAVRARHVRALRMIDARANYHAGLVLMQQGRHREAAEALERTLLFYPEHIGARGNLGLMYVGAVNYVDRGIEHLVWAIAREKDPSFRNALQKSLNAARARLDEYIELRGGLPADLDPPERGAIGQPWKVVAEEGM